MKVTYKNELQLIASGHFHLTLRAYKIVYGVAKEVRVGKTVRL